MVPHISTLQNRDTAQLAAEELARQEVTVDWLYDSKDAWSAIQRVFCWTSDDAESMGLDPWRFNPDLDAAQERGWRFFVQVSDLPERDQIIFRICKMIRPYMWRSGYVESGLDSKDHISIWVPKRFMEHAPDDEGSSDELDGFVIKMIEGITFNGPIVETWVGMSTLGWGDLPLEDLKLVEQWVTEEIDKLKKGN
jgi:hypothetical protein